MSPRLRRFVFGAPRDVKDPDAFHKISLVALLAWVGLGADGLSSSAYGPDEAYRTLVRSGAAHASLAAMLALGMAVTVFIISYTYSRIIERFPSGGGGYVVATRLLGPRFGVVSGSALLVDYVLTITVSIAAGGDAIFSMVPRAWVLRHTPDWFMLGQELVTPAHIGTWLDPVQRVKVTIEIVAIVLLVILNIRGVKESVQAIVPIFAAFVITHVVLLVVVLGGHLGTLGSTAHETATNLRSTVSSLGAMGALALFVRAYSLGGGTYTGIEAVSNGVPIMREPKVRTAKRTMVLMATSLSITAGGILLSYLLVHAIPVDGKTMNAVLLERVAGGWQIGHWHVGTWFVVTALAAEALLLFIAAQAGFVDGPRVMANMAVDSWLPHRFAALSETLSMQNGVVLMGGASMAALLYTHGDVSRLVVMYSINVFLTFSLSNLGMSRFWIGKRKELPEWRRHLPWHVLGLALCLTILVVTCYEKFGDGGWLTLVFTGAVVAACFAIKRHYGLVVTALRRLDADLPSPPECEVACPDPVLVQEPYAEGPIHGVLEHHGRMDPDPARPVAVLLVGGYSGLGRHALLTLLRMFPHHFDDVVFMSVAVIDSESFKGSDQVEQLEQGVRDSLLRYERYAQTLGLRAASMFATGTEVAVEAEKMALDIVQRYTKAVFVAGQLVFNEDTVTNRALHNETAFTVQRRLQRKGLPMIVAPVRIDLRTRAATAPVRAVTS